MANEKKLFEVKRSLSKYGNVEVLKDGVVFTVLILGKGLTNAATYFEILSVCKNYADARFPLVEVLKNADTFFLAIFKPDPLPSNQKQQHP